MNLLVGLLLLARIFYITAQETPSAPLGLIEVNG